jgi:fermentation-respiration switch protein FrsA (DUF1100 family)
MKTLWTLVIVLALAYAALVLFVYVFQSRLLYFPQVGREVSITPQRIGLTFEDVWLKSAPDVDIHGWYVPHPNAKGTVLFFHGNAGSIALRLDWLRMFHDLGYAVLIIDYRGYGRSAGSPTEGGTYEDATAAWTYLTQVRGTAPRDIVIVGESLGGAVAAELAARTTPRAVILQSTFTSIPTLAGEIYRFLPVRWISRHEYDTRARIQRISAPILIAHSPGDEIIPYRHGRELFERAGEPKHFIELHGGHNGGFLFGRPAWVSEVGIWLQRFERG